MVSCHQILDIKFVLFSSYCAYFHSGHGGRIFSIALSQLSDGRRIAASASHDRTVKVWNIDDLSLLHTIEYSDFVWRVFIVVDPKPLVIAFVSTEDKIQVHSARTVYTYTYTFTHAYKPPPLNT
ncbi:hypothetical protein EON65_21770 [archaeon]|nr:MAG: hypothetical protein EON65_21770 [archaeon]